MRIKNPAAFIFVMLMTASPQGFASQSAAGAGDIADLKNLVLSLQASVRDLQSTVKEQNDTLRVQAQRIQALESGEPSRTLAGPTSAPAGAPALDGVRGFNPEVGLAGTFQAGLTEKTEDEEGNDTLALKELELSFASYVDPYSRLDAIFAFNDNLEDQNVDIEEAYYSHWGLPWGFRGQIGKFRAKIGKQNLQHLHQLETVDYAWVIRDFFGEEGLSSSGLRLVHDIPNPWDIPLEISGEVLRGNNGNSFSGISRRPIFNVHGKTFFETSENTNLELGWTTMFGDENPRVTELNDAGEEEEEVVRAAGQDRYGVQVYGADVTWNWLMEDERALMFRNEIYFQGRGTSPHPNENPWGFYSLLDYRFHKRFSGGLRFDYLEPLGVVGEHSPATGISPYLTFWQSEFASFQIQYSHTEPASASERSDDAVYLRANFLIGAHKHPVQ